jgi:hypothetical protein
MTIRANAHTLDTIPFIPDIPAMLTRLRIKEGSANAAEFRGIVLQGAALAHPKAFYLEAYVTGRGEDWVEIEGLRFSSRVLRVNLEPVYRVFPFLATCGQEMQAWSAGFEDIQLRYWAEMVNEFALFGALQAFEQHLEQHYRPGKTAMMNPGSLEDRPLPEHNVLFELFGAGAERIGVQLSESLLMAPTKSVSGIRFPMELDYENCQLCSRDECPGRRAPYDSHLYDQRYSLHSL